VQAVLLNHRRDGTPFWNELRISSVRSGSGEITHYVASQQDVTARVDRERRTTYLAYHDELTSLPNRAHVLEHLDLEMRRARRTGSSVAAVLLDLDGFKTINDRLGHAAGDAALAGAAQRLRSVIRSGDLLGRFGGDEFLVVLAGLPSAAGAGPGGGSAVDRVVDRICAQLHAALDLPVQLAGSDVRLSVSSGAAVFPRDAGEPAELVARADAAMYRNKARP
jgi:diguanylate cyclase (GGDEF)-like protein